MSPVAGELGPRRNGGLPRVQSPPERNIVQNPALARAIQRTSGSRQAHVASSLTEGLTPVLLSGDVREDPRTGRPESYATVQEIVPDGINVKRNTFVNPLGNDKVAVLRRLHVYLGTDMITGYQAEFVYNLITPIGFAFAPVRGQRLVTGFIANAGGVAQPQPPVVGTDIIFPPVPSACGFHNPPLQGIDGGYIWHGLIGGKTSASAPGPEILEDFNAITGPRIIVFPGGCFQCYAIANDAHWYANLWWDEYPLT